MARKHWRDLTAGQRWAFVAMSTVEVGMAAFAWNDLAHRPQEAVNRKPLCAPAIAVNFVGPITRTVQRVHPGSPRTGSLSIHGYRRAVRMGPCRAGGNRGTKNSPGQGLSVQG